MSQEKLSSIESDVKAIQSRMSRSNIVTVVVGVVAIALVSGYFIYGYREINSVLKPDLIVSLAKQQVDDNIPKIKSTVQEEVEKNAPIWAESLSNQAVESVPQLREALVDYTVEQTNELIDASVEMSDQSFDRFVLENRDAIEEAMTELETNDEISVAVLDAIQEGFGNALRADFKRDAEEILAYTTLMQEKMKRLKTGKNLTEAESLERQAFMIMRRLQLTELKNNPVVLPSD